MKGGRFYFVAFCAVFFFVSARGVCAPDSAEEMLAELSGWVVTWLDDKGESILRPKVDGLRKKLAKDALLYQQLRQGIAQFEDEGKRDKGEHGVELVRAAMFDMIGAQEQAFDLYRAELDEGKSSSIIVSKHLVRLLHQKKALLDLEDEKKGLVRHSVDELTFIFVSQPHFEDCMAIIEDLTAYLKSRSPEEDAGYVGWLTWADKVERKVTTALYGDMQMPSIWGPGHPRHMGYRGRIARVEEIEWRQQAYRDFCLEALRFPKMSAWAFSRLAALADLQGDFENNDRLLELADFAISIRKKDAPFGSIPIGQVARMESGYPEARFYSPELYVAYYFWKRQQGLPQDSSEGVRKRYALLACKAAGFMELANDLIRKNIPDEPELIRRQNGKVFFIANQLTQRFSEVLKIWKARDCDAQIFDGVMKMEKDLVKHRLQSIHQSKQNLRYFLDLLARYRKPTRVDEALEQLATIYLGQPGKRDQALKTLPPENVFVDYFGEPLPVRYLGILKDIVFYPALIFPAHRKAVELGIDNRLNTGWWIRRKDIENNPALVFEKLEWSPLMQNLPEFRLLAVGSYDFMSISVNREPTVFGRLAKDIRERSAKQQKAYLEYFASQKSFGAKLMLAALAKNQGKAIQDLLRLNLDVIRKQDEIFKQELALFALPKLPKSGSGEIEEVISGAFPKANKARLEVLEKRVRNESMLASFKSESDRSQLLALILQNDPDEAFGALRRVAAIIKERGPIDDYEKQAFLRRDFSWLFDFLRDVRRHLKDERVFYKFYLRVLADAKLGKGLFIDGSWLTPKFDMGNGPEAEQKQFEQGLLWAAENLPDSLPAEYLIFSSIGRWGWVSSRGRPGVSTDEFLQRVGKNFSGEQRKMIAASLILGKNNVEWRFRDLSEPGWKDPAVAEAFVEMGKRIANEKLPFNLRLALAREICDNCQFHTPMDLRLSFARLLAQAWEEDVQVKGGEEDSILHLFVYGGSNPEWAEVADRLLKAWRNRIEKMDGEYGEVIQLYSQSPGWLVGVAAARGDEGNLNWLLGARWEKNLASTPLEALSALIREGEIKRALRYAQNSSEYFIRKKNANRRVLFDRQLAKHLPDFLGKIEDLEFRAVLAAYIALLEADHFDPEMPVKEERILAVAKSVGELDFKNTEYRNAVLTFIGNDSAAAAQLTEKYIAAARINDLKAVFKSKEKYSWKFIAHPMIVGLVAAGEYDHALEVLKKIAAQTEAKNQSYDRIWEVLSDAVSDGVTLCQNDPNKLAGMLEITSYMAALSDQRIPSVRTRAANYARNIYSHARVDRMEEWQDWRRGLDPEVRKKLDRDWFKKSGWAINLTATRMPHDAPVGQRIALMQAMLSLPEIIGKSGSLYSHAMTNLQKSGLFDADEFLLHGEAIASVIPDGGHAWRALADLAKKNGDAENAARFLKEAEKMGE